MAETPRIVNVGWFGSGGGVYTHDCPLLCGASVCRITRLDCEVDRTGKLPRHCPLRKGSVRIQATVQEDWMLTRSTGVGA